MPSSLEIDHAGGDPGAAAADVSSKPLGERVINAIQGLPDRTIRPARLAALLGHDVSVNEACAELCGLMAAVGGGQDGAYFRFEKLEEGAGPNSVNVMSFTFPCDFAERALRNRRRQERWQDLQAALHVVVRGLKIVTAFGLILSLLILLIAAVVGVVAVLIASQNDRGGRGQGLALRQLHSLFYTFRQLLWCYAIFAPDMGPDDDNRDPFLRETAYDLALLCSVCCGNPGSIFWMMRAHQLSNRRHRIYRGWSGGSSAWGNRSSAAASTTASAYGIEGVSLIRRGGADDGAVLDTTTSTESRGLLSVAVEFLFGPTPFHPPNVESDKWQLRAAVIVQVSSAQGGISLLQLAPYADEPPASIDNSTQTVQQGLVQVAFLNGVPKEETKDSISKADATRSNDRSTALFVFPELMAESTTVLRYDRRPDDAYDGGMLNMLYANPNMEAGRRMTSRRPDLPSFWKEAYYHFTKLSAPQFMYCLGLGLLNAFGVYWFGQSLQPSGALGPLVQGTLRTVLVGGLYPVLSFYAKLFFLLPAGRLALVSYLNHVRRQRNAKRLHLSQQLKASSTTTL